MKLISFLDNSHASSLSSCQKFSDDSLCSMPLDFDCRKNLQHLYQIQDRLQSDLVACDARLSLFVAAANSYRYETLLRPFPKDFLDNKGRPNIDAIFEVFADIERLEAIMHQLIKGNYGCCPLNVLKLLYAVLVKHGERVALSTLRPCEFDDLFTHLKIPEPQVMPTHIFEVTPSLKCAHTQAYASLREQCPARIGFYGGKLEQLYAMLTEGSLPQDEPLQLTFDVDEALKGSPYTAGWGGSRCGAVLCCVAVVEFVVVPEHVEVMSDNCHVVIKDANCMQISYLMFFGQSYAKYETSLMLKPKLSLNWDEATKWMENNKYTISLGVYLMILSLSSSSGRGVLHKFATTGLYVLKRGFLKI